MMGLRSALQHDAGRPAVCHTTTVFKLMRRASLRIGLLSVLVVGCVLTAATGLLLHVSTQRNLELQARSVAYSVEAAVVFRDAAATEALLKELLQREPIASAVVSVTAAPGVQGAVHTPDPAAGVPDLPAAGHDLMRPFAAYRQPRDERPWDTALGTVWPVTATAPVVVQGRQHGEVRLQADASMMLKLLAWAGAGVLLAMAVAGMAVLRVSRRVAEQLVLPLQALAQHTRRVRLQQDRRSPAPRAGVRELDELSTDFDALLDDLETHQQKIIRQHGELVTAHAQLAEQVRVDTLTGAATRSHFEATLALAIQQCALEQSQLSLYFVDANHFKRINDRYGHEAGDEVLAALARRLRSQVRETDLVGRLGGDEFVVLVRGLRQSAHAKGLAEQLRDAVGQPLELSSGQILVPGVSVGVSVYPKDAQNAQDLIKMADKDMYRQKRSTSR